VAVAVVLAVVVAVAMAVAVCRVGTLGRVLCPQGEATVARCTKMCPVCFAMHPNLTCAIGASALIFLASTPNQKMANVARGAHGNIICRTLISSGCGAVGASALVDLT